MQNTMITTEEVKARWAYSEISSSRLGKRFKNLLPAGIVDNQSQGLPFEQLPDEDRHALIRALKTVRPAAFVNVVETLGTGHFELATWTIAQLVGCVTLPDFGGVRYFQFLARPYNSEQADEIQPDLDPRREALRIAFDKDFKVKFPLIAVRSGQHDVLLDGYLRSILWLRNPIEPLPVWVPAK